MNHPSKAEGAAMLERDQQGAVAILTLADPARRNALSSALMGALRSALDETSRDERTRSLVLAARGPVFCAGHDLREIRAARAAPDGGRAAFERLIGTCTDLMLALAQVPCPVVACVEGLATAAGCQLVASCDLAVAAETASFCTPGVDIGLFCSTPSVPLLQAVPFKAAAEMLFTGHAIAAHRAFDLGLVNRVVPAGAALDAAVALASEIAAKSPQAVRRGKALLAARRLPGLRAAYEEAGRAMVDNLLAADAEEGIGAFLDKRKPNWRT
jgi:enoyl-CoA hydratase/carnithine racemase